MRHDAQGFQNPVLIKSYLMEGAEFKKTISVKPKSVLPRNAKDTLSHTINKIKYDDDKKLKLKERSAPNGNK